MELFGIFALRVYGISVLPLEIFTTLLMAQIVRSWQKFSTCEALRLKLSK